MDHLKTNVPAGVVLTEARIIEGDAGIVLHGLRHSDPSFVAFGEAYFSVVYEGKKKGWKKHTRMTLNVVVPVGEIGFVLFDDREGSATQGSFYEITLSRSNYLRLTVPPGIWMAFCGIGKEENMLLNVASLSHDPQEALVLPIENEYINYHWQ